MSSIQDITAADVADADPVTANVGQTLSKVRNKMEDHNLRTIPVVDGAVFEGMLGYRQVMEKLRADPSTTKIDPLLHQSPEITEDQNVVELSRLRIDSGRKKFALTDQQGRLEGVIGEEELVQGARDADELQGRSIDEIMTADVITTENDASHETARKLLMDNNISRLPVINDAGELVGVITSNDLFRGMVPREQMSKGDYKSTKDNLSDIPVSEVMRLEDEYNRTIIDDEQLSLREAIDRMQENGKLELIIVSDDRPTGIVTMKDFVDFFAGHEVVNQLQVALTGADVPEEKAAIHDKVETAINGGLGRVLENPDELRIHVKKYEQDGKRHKYSLNFRLASGKGVTTVKAHGWNLLDVVDEGLDELETVIKKEQEKRRDREREQEREEKYS